MPTTNPATSALIAATASAAATAVPIGRLGRRPLSLLVASAGVVSAAATALGMSRAGSGEHDAAPSATRPGAVAAVAAVGGVMAAGSAWLGWAVDRGSERWLRRRGVSRPRPWMMLAAGVLGAAAGVSEKPGRGPRS